MRSRNAGAASHRCVSKAASMHTCSCKMIAARRGRPPTEMKQSSTIRSEGHRASTLQYPVNHWYDRTTPNLLPICDSSLNPSRDLCRSQRDHYYTTAPVWGVPRYQLSLSECQFLLINSELTLCATPAASILLVSSPAACKGRHGFPVPAPFFKPQSSSSQLTWRPAYLGLTLEP